jgi:hypothetical protein
VCGLNCAKCRALAARQCEGCRGPLDHRWGADCKFVPCAKDKSLTYCFECEQFPCEKLLAFAADGHDHHRITVENMKRMKQVGLETWLAEQAEPMFCPGWRF